MNFIFALWGQGWNEREVIYSSLIGTTLPLLLYHSASVLKESFHDFCPSESQETDVGSGPAFSVQDRKAGRESARWHFVCMWTCSSVDLWSVSALLKHLPSLQHVSKQRLHLWWLGAGLGWTFRICSELYFFFLTVAWLLALKRVVWNGNPVPNQLAMNHLLGGGGSDSSLTCD